VKELESDNNSINDDDKDLHDLEKEGLGDISNYEISGMDIDIVSNAIKFICKKKIYILHFYTYSYIKEI